MTGRGPAELPHSFQTGITKSINSSTTIEARIAVQSQATELTDAGEGACELRMMLRNKKELTWQSLVGESFPEGHIVWRWSRSKQIHPDAHHVSQQGLHAICPVRGSTRGEKSGGGANVLETLVRCHSTWAPGFWPGATVTSGFGLLSSSTSPCTPVAARSPQHASTRTQREYPAERGEHRKSKRNLRKTRPR